MPDYRPPYTINWEQPQYDWTTDVISSATTASAYTARAAADPACVLEPLKEELTEEIAHKLWKLVSEVLQKHISEEEFITILTEQ